MHAKCEYITGISQNLQLNTDKIGRSFFISPDPKIYMKKKVEFNCSK